MGDKVMSQINSWTLKKLRFYRSLIGVGTKPEIYKWTDSTVLLSHTPKATAGALDSVSLGQESLSQVER